MEAISKIEELESRLAEIQHEAKKTSMELRLLKMEAATKHISSDVEKITKLVCMGLNTTFEVICRQSKNDESYIPRHVLSTLLRQYTPLSYKEIAEHVDSEKSAVHHSVRNLLTQRLPNDPVYRKYKELESCVIYVLNP